MASYLALAAMVLERRNGVWTSRQEPRRFPAPGANQIFAYATDDAGNSSTTNTVSVTYLLREGKDGVGDGRAQDFDLPGVENSQTPLFGEKQVVVAELERHRAADGAWVLVAHESGTDAVGGHWVETDDEQAGGDELDVGSPGTFTAFHGDNAIDNREVDGTGFANVGDDSGDAEERAVGEVGFQLSGHEALAAVFLPVVQRAAAGGAAFVRSLIAVEGIGGEAEEVLHGHRHAAGQVVLELAERHEHIGLFIRPVKLEG